MSLFHRFGIIGMTICVVMQYIRTGILSNQTIADVDITNNVYVWAIPPVILLIGLLIGIVRNCENGLFFSIWPRK